jgi:DNA-binding GntR family transcriptional regulator
MTTLLDARRRRADRARQVADVLRHQVLAGLFPDGQLPRESRLAQDFGVSRTSVRPCPLRESPWHWSTSASTSR